jgi:hypothetical protein
MSISIGWTRAHLDALCAERSHLAADAALAEMEARTFRAEDGEAEAAAHARQEAEDALAEWDDTHRSEVANLSAFLDAEDAG